MNVRLSGFSADKIFIPFVAPQERRDNDIDVQPLHKFPLVEEDEDGWSQEDDEAENLWNADFNRHRRLLFESKSELFDAEGQLSPQGADNMLETLKDLLEEMLVALKETKMKDCGHEVFVTLHPFDRIRFTNLGGALFISSLMLVLLGSNNKSDKHSGMVMGLLSQGVTMEDQDPGRKKRKNKEENRTAQALGI